MSTQVNSELYHEFLCWLLRDKPRIEREDAMLKLRTEGETYWVLSGVDLRALLEARKYVLGLKELPQ